MAALRKTGAVCAVVEKFNQYAGPHGIRQDLFGFVDVLVLDPERGFIGVQCCARSGRKAHWDKITQDCHEMATLWLQAGGKIELWSWAKQKEQRGGKRMVWTPRVDDITMEDMPETFDYPPFLPDRTE